MKEGTIWVVYFSPSGTTRKVAEIIAKEAEREQKPVNLHNLADPKLAVDQIYRGLSTGDILFLGSPTYAHHPVPAVTEFIGGLPESLDARAAAFVTYGGVTSGTALYDMANTLKTKGFGILGGIKVLAVHSLLWHVDTPVGAGHPDEDDERKIGEFVRRVLEKAKEPDTNPLPLEALDYQSESLKKEAEQSSLELLKAMMPPLEVNTEICTQCGVCQDSCPAENIQMSPFPEFRDRCILCYNCIRLCEPDAVTSPVLPILEAEIHKRREEYNEPQETRFFV